MDRNASNHFCPSRPDTRALVDACHTEMPALPPASDAVTARLDGFFAFLAAHLAPADHAEALGRLANGLAGHALDVARSGQPVADLARWFEPLAEAAARAAVISPEAAALGEVCLDRH